MDPVRDVLHLSEKALQARRRVLDMVLGAGRGHIGGSLSCTEILVTLYQGGILNVDPTRPDWPDRDRMILSKGHSVEVLYAVLADFGFFSLDELATYGEDGTRLGGHADGAVPGVDVSTGSLGHGLGIGAGLALAANLDSRAFFTVVVMGDGECYEGSVWESAMFAAHHDLSNLVAIVDRNNQITLDFTESAVRLEPFAEKWEACGWEVARVDGHSFDSLIDALGRIREREANRPLMILAETVKGKGVSFMEGQVGWHHNVPGGELLERARSDLASGI